MMADFRDAMEEADRVRTLGLMGLEELTHALEREESKLGAAHKAENLTPGTARRLQAAWERTELARAELSNESPHTNAQALISMNSALDAMVEDLVKFWRGFHVERLTKAFIEKGAAVPIVLTDIPPEAREVIERVVREQIESVVPASLKPKGVGALRYEKPLRRIGWGAPADRAIPGDLDTALTELGALRDVLVHRAGRIDATALKLAPTLGYELGQFVRISRESFRTYSAAVRCYGLEIGFRGIRNWPEVTDEKNGPNLVGWRDYVMVNA